MTHTAKCPERFREHRAGSLVFLPGVFSGFGSGSHHLIHEIAHGLRRLILHLPGGVGVGAKGKPRVVVAQHTGDCLDIHAVLECQGGEGMPLWHNRDKSETPCGATGWLVCPYSFSIKFPAKNRHNEGCQKVRHIVKDKKNVYYPAGTSTSWLGAFYQQGTGR